MYDSFQRRNKTDGFDQRALETIREQFVSIDNGENKDAQSMGFRRSDSSMSLPNFGSVKQADCNSEDASSSMGTRREKKREEDNLMQLFNSIHIDNNGTQKQNGRNSKRGKEKDDEKRRDILKGSNGIPPQVAVTSRLPKTLLPHLSLSKKNTQTKSRSVSSASSIPCPTSTPINNSLSGSSNHKLEKNGTLSESKYGTVGVSKGDKKTGGSFKENGKYGSASEVKTTTVSDNNKSGDLAESKFDSLSENTWALGDPSIRNSLYGIYSIYERHPCFHDS